MDKLWAPWRDEYISTVETKKKECVFCKIRKQKKDKKNLILFRSSYCFAVLNLYPYNNGHILILPNRHVGDLDKLTQPEMTDFINLLKYAKSILTEVLKPAGYNIGMNLGRIAGAGVPGHVHFHLVPRWKGDVNFMPVVGSTKVISQSLKELYQQVYRAHLRRKKRT